MDLQQFEDKFNQAFSALKRDTKKPNILIVGATGVGKSSLINACFGEELAQVGVGKPVTKRIQSFATKSKSVVLFDSMGYEIGSNKEKKFLQEVFEYTTEFKTTEQAIHIVWYCIQAGGGRVVNFDIETVKQLQRLGLPVAMVLTKADLLNEQDATILRVAIKKDLPTTAIFETTINPELDYLQLNDLIQWSADNLESGLKVSFIAAQRRNINLKRDQAHKVILQHTTGATFVGFSPIPFSDAPLLLSNQAGMVARILFVYDMGNFAVQIQPLLGSAVISSLITESGLWLVAQLSKLMPGLGTLVGGMINATVAAAITYSIGFAVSEVCAVFSEKVLRGNAAEIKAFMDNIDTFFADEVMKNFKKRSQL